MHVKRRLGLAHASLGILDVSKPLVLEECSNGGEIEPEWKALEGARWTLSVSDSCQNKSTL